MAILLLGILIGSSLTWIVFLEVLRAPLKVDGGDLKDQNMALRYKVAELQELIRELRKDVPEIH